MNIFITIIAGLIVFIISAYLYSRYIWFFRDPKREPARGGRVIISPADGQVVYIKRIAKGMIQSEKLGRQIDLSDLSKTSTIPSKEDGWLIGIYMSPFDVHYNYTPVNGRVLKIVHTEAKANLPMVDMVEYINISFLRRAFDNFAKRFHFENERNTLVIEGEEFNVVIVEIADKFVNKISCYVEEGQDLSVGQKIGFIERGSQVDIAILSTDIKIKVEFGEQVYGAKTVLADY